MTVTQEMKDGYIRDILAATPYTPEAFKYASLQKDLSKLTMDTLLILKLNMKRKQEVK